MAKFTLIAVLATLCVLDGWASSQNYVGQSASSSTLSTSPSDFSEDQTFAQYQRVTKGIKPPKATYSPDPKFPDLPPDAEQRGTVVMLIGVNGKGHVGPVRVLRSDEHAFEASAVEAVKKWRFKPAEKDGKSIPVQVTVEMKFAR